MFRFLLANLTDFSPAAHLLPFKSLDVLDQCFLALLNDCCESVLLDLEKFNLQSV
jgi:isoleucyl-tRNA synthetase